MPDMRAYPRYLPRYPISDMKNPHPIRSRYPIFRTLVANKQKIIWLKRCNDIKISKSWMEQNRGVSSKKSRYISGFGLREKVGIDSTIRMYIKDI